jgi:hypothetical protein
MKYCLMTLLFFNSFAEDRPIYHFGNSINGFDSMAYEVNDKLLVNPLKKDEKKYRYFVFEKNGEISFFSNVANKNGAHNYFIFPMGNDLKVQTSNSSHLILNHPSGISFEFLQDGSLNTKNRDIEINVDPIVSLDNKGGIEISKFSHGVILDVGWSNSRSPHEDPSRQIIFTDKKEKKCPLPYSTFFKTIYSISKNGKRSFDRYEMIYPDNKRIAKFLTKNCVFQFDVSDLINESIPKVVKEVTAVTKNIGRYPAIIPTDEDLAYDKKPEVIGAGRSPGNSDNKDEKGFEDIIKKAQDSSAK